MNCGAVDTKDVNAVKSDIINLIINNICWRIENILLKILLKSGIIKLNAARVNIRKR